MLRKKDTSMMMENSSKLSGNKIKNNIVEKIAIYSFAAILLSIIIYAFFQLFIV
jgi:hypothetical protein